MSSMLGSQGLVLATAMAVSAGTVILLDIFRVKYFPSIHLSDQQDYPPDEKQILKSCLYSAGKNKNRARKKKKRVHFAADVKSSSGNGEDYRRKHTKKCTEIRNNSCGNEIMGMPGLHLWDQIRQQWVGHKKPVNQPQQLCEPILNWNATYDSLFGSNKPLPKPTPLAEMEVTDGVSAMKCNQLRQIEKFYSEHF